MKSTEDYYTFELSLIEGELAEFVTLSYEAYAVFLYYAYTIDTVKAFKLFKATLSRLNYSRIYDEDLPLTEDNEFLQVISLSELSDVINFINIDILPGLQAIADNGTEQKLMQTWETSSLEFADFLNYEVEDFFKNIEYYQSNYFEEFNEKDLLKIFTLLSSFYQMAFDNNSNYMAEIIF